MIRTKIVATLGPATPTCDALLRLMQEGVDVCRLNFSHGDLAEHERLLACVREAEGQFGQPVAVLGDLGGPKIRLGKIADADGSGGMPIDVGDRLVVQREPTLGADGRVSTTYPHFVDDVSVGDRVLIEDGLLRFIAVEKTADEVFCTCTTGGVLKSGKGINLPTTRVSIPSITERDWQCVEWAIEHDLDYLALSFVRRADELMQLRQRLVERKSHLHIVAKIEKPEALEHIDAIIDASDGLMVARGDLGVEMDVARVPIIQKDLIRRCQGAGKPVIVATQMLQSMIEQSSPTRAEVSDVANAILDGADAVMLSGETSVGKHGPMAVRMMNHVAEMTEQYLDSLGEKAHPPQVRDKAAPFSGAIAHGVWEIARELDVQAVVVWSQTGRTARVFSKHRFSAPIIAPAVDAAVARRMALLYGVEPQLMAEAPADMAGLVATVDRLLREKRLAAEGQRIVIIAGSSLAAPLTINKMVVHVVGSPVAVESAGPAGLTRLVELEKQ